MGGKYVSSLVSMTTNKCSSYCVYIMHFYATAVSPQMTLKALKVNAWYSCRFICLFTCFDLNDR